MHRFLLVLFAWSLVPVSTHAASLYIDPPFTDLYRSDAVIASIRVDVDRDAGECVNAFDIVLNYSGAVLPVDISLGQSIVPFWVEFPTINTANRTITMAGGIPNGYCGRVAGDTNLTNVLVDVVFRLPGNEPIGEGSSIVSFGPETTVYLNDGFGTVAPLRTFQAEYRLFDEAGEVIKDEWTEAIMADRTPPEAFEVLLQAGNLETNGQRYIEFNTTDKQSGLSHYEIIEERDVKNSFFSFGAANAPWQEVRSPFILEDQSLRSIIRVKAVDKAGNEYIATLLPSRSGLTSGEWLVVGGSGGLLVLLGGLLLWHFRKRKVLHGDTSAVSQTTNI